MPDSLVEKYTGRPAPAIAASNTRDPVPEPEVIESDLGCFGWLRGVKEGSLMLELRKKDGHVLAIGYSWIERIEYQPEEGITLHTPGRAIRIVGSGLYAEVREGVSLFAGLIRHRVPWIRESDRTGLLQPQRQAASIDSIEWNG